MEDSVHLALCIPENKPGFMEKHIEEKKKMFFNSHKKVAA